MLLLLWHLLRRILIAPWDEIFLWSNHWMFSDITPSHSWVEFSRSSSYMLVISLDISLGVFKDDTCEIQWRQKYSSLFWLGLSFAFLWLHLCLDLQLFLWHSSSCFFKYGKHSIIPCLEVIDSFKLVLKLGTVCYYDKNENLKWK